jgi:hypothetical protein
MVPHGALNGQADCCLDAVRVDVSTVRSRYRDGRSIFGFDQLQQRAKVVRGPESVVTRIGIEVSNSWQFRARGGRGAYEGIGQFAK